MKIILITGHAREGKTTLANKLSERFDICASALADPLKEITYDLFNLFEKDIPSTKEEIRPYFQKIGTDICRKRLGNNIWCIVLENLFNGRDKYIISDIRFPNEVEYFRSKYDALIIRVKNKYINNYLNHESEKYIDDIKYDYIYHIGVNDEDERLYDYISKWLMA